MAKPPCARLTKPIRPIVTDRPTETMNSTMPAATPPRIMLAMSTPKITRGGWGGLGGPSRPPQLQSGHPAHRSTPRPSRDIGGRSKPPILLTRARPDLLLLAGVLDPVDLSDDLLEHAAVLHARLGQVLVHHNIAGDRVDHDRTARARELPALERLQCRVGLDLALERVDDVDDRSHAVVAADRHEVGRRAGAVLLLPRLDEALVLRIVEVGVVVVHGDEAARRRAHRLELRVLRDVARADQPDAGVAHAERRVGLDDRGGVVAGRNEDEEHVRLLVLGALEERREVGYGGGA